MRIAPTAIIDPTARIETDVHIGPYAIIGPNVCIDSHTRIGPYTVIERNTRIGKHNTIHGHAVIGGDPQDKKYNGEESFLSMEHHNTIREFSTIHRGTQGNHTRIGSHNLFMAYSHVAHDAVVHDHCTFANGATLGGHVQVYSYATLGGLCAVHQHCRVGSHAMLAGGSMLVQDLPPYLMAQGDRAKLCGINRVGLRRSDIERTSIDVLHKAYKTLFLGGLQKGVQTLEQDLAQQDPPCAELQSLLRFVQSSQRGICKARK